MRKFSSASVVALSIALAACGQTSTDTTSNGHTSEKEASVSEAATTVYPDDPFAQVAAADAGDAAGNLLLSEYDGPYGGVPHFDEVNLAGLKPALEAGMSRQLAEIDAIIANTDAPTFANTIVALEKAGDDLGRVFTYWGIWSSNNSSPEFRAIQGEMAPKLSEFFTTITQNEALFARVKSVYESDEKKTLTNEEQRLVWLTYDQFASNGATLDGDAKARYGAINKRLAELHTKFANNVLADEENYVTYISADQLSGLPQSFVDAASAAANERDRDGEYAILNTRSSICLLYTSPSPRDS